MISDILYVYNDDYSLCFEVPITIDDDGTITVPSFEIPSVETSE